MQVIDNSKVFYGSEHRPFTWATPHTSKGVYARGISLPQPGILVLMQYTSQINRSHFIQRPCAVITRATIIIRSHFKHMKSDFLALKYHKIIHKIAKIPQNMAIAMSTYVCWWYQKLAECSTSVINLQVTVTIHRWRSNMLRRHCLSLTCRSPCLNWYLQK